MPQLPGTDLTVRDLCLGGNVFGWTADEPASFAMLDRYDDATPSTQSPFVDTAESYGSGASERILGAWMADRGQFTKEFVPYLSMAKYHATEMAVRASNVCLQLLGAENHRAAPLIRLHRVVHQQQPRTAARTSDHRTSRQ